MTYVDHYEMELSLTTSVYVLGEGVGFLDRQYIGEVLLTNVKRVYLPPSTM